LSSYTAYIVDKYYVIDSIILDYNNDASGAYQYVTPVGAPASTNTSNVGSTGLPRQFITAFAHDVCTNERIVFPLTKALNAYSYNNEENSASQVIR